jgi:lysozyme
VSRARVLTALVIACLSLVGLAAPAGAFVTGVDVASWQHPGTSGTTCGSPIDWYAVKNAGHSFAYIKATESTTYTNPCFAQDWQGAANAGLYRGAYHYARPALPISIRPDTSSPALVR